MSHTGLSAALMSAPPFPERIPLGTFLHLRTKADTTVYEVTSQGTRNGSGWQHFRTPHGDEIRFFPGRSGNASCQSSQGVGDLINIDEMDRGDASAYAHVYSGTTEDMIIVPLHGSVSVGSKGEVAARTAQGAEMCFYFGDATVIILPKPMEVPAAFFRL